MFMYAKTQFYTSINKPKQGLNEEKLVLREDQRVLLDIGIYIRAVHWSSLKNVLCDMHLFSQLGKLPNTTAKQMDF